MRTPRYAVISLALLLALLTSLIFSTQETQAQALTAELPGSVSADLGSAAPTPAAASKELLDVSLTLTPRNEALLETTLTDLYNPASPQYRKWLSQEQF